MCWQHWLKRHPALRLLARECLSAIRASAFVPIHVHLLYGIDSKMRRDAATGSR